MNAIVCTRYGSPAVLQLTQVAKPTPRENEILIRTYATTVTSGDGRVRSRRMPYGFGLLSRLVLGVRRPRQPILGTELAGDVEAIGSGVTRFKVGDPVFAFAGARMGGHAEYVCMREDGAVALKPANLTYDEAASISFGGVTALDFMILSGEENFRAAREFWSMALPEGSARQPFSLPATSGRM